MRKKPVENFKLVHSTNDIQTNTESLVHIHLGENLNALGPCWDLHEAGKDICTDPPKSTMYSRNKAES